MVMEIEGHLRPPVPADACKNLWKHQIFFPQQRQNAMGSLHNIDFGVLWARWGGSGKEPGSGNRFQVSMGSAGGAPRFRWVPTSSGVRKVVPGNWFRVSIGSEVRKVAMLSGEEVLNILAVGDTTYAYFFVARCLTKG